MAEVKLAVDLLESLEFPINWKKSVITPTKLWSSLDF